MACIKAEMPQKQWVTVNSVTSLNDVLDRSGNASGRSNAAEKNNDKTNVNQVNEANVKRPIKSQEQHNPRKQVRLAVAFLN